MAVTLLSLPPEVLERILLFTGPLHILTCESTCRTLRDIIQNSTMIQYQVALYSACKVDGLRDDVSLAHCLDTLRQREQAWNEPRWRERLKVKLPTNLRIDFLNIELSCGILLVRSDLRHGGAHLAWCTLPSLGDPQRDSPLEWHRLTIDLRLCGMRIDSGQDLLFYLQDGYDPNTATQILDIHLRTLSTNLPHPDASHAIIRLALPVNFHLQFQRTIVKIHGTHVGILISSPTLPNQDCFILYDWKKAIRKGLSSYFHYVVSDQRPLPNTLRRRWKSVSFLSNNHILLPNPASDCLDLYAYSTEPNSFRHVASFVLPKLCDGFLRNIWLRPDDGQISTSPEFGHPIYQDDSEESVVAFILCCYYDGGDAVDAVDHICAFVTHVTSLLSYLDYPKMRTMSTLEESAVIYVPWESWGIESATHMSDIDASNHPRVRGTRLGLLSWKPKGGGSLILFDFNRHCKRVDSKIGPCCIGLSPNDPWDYGVHPSLRYRKVTMVLVEYWQEFLMDDERIIGISTDGKTLDILFM